MRSYDRGLWGERKARIFLEKHGYIFLDQRARTPAGEIDLIMMTPETLVFVEVKVRASFRQALECFSKRQALRMQNAALMWMESRKHHAVSTISPNPLLLQCKENRGFPDQLPQNMRFDWIGISSLGWIHHIPNALSFD